MKAKNKDLKVERFIINEMYNLADYYGFADNGNVERAESEIKEILDAVFSSDMVKAQALINEYTEKSFSLMGRKAQEKANRNLV